jgi:hypothetical protein
LNGVQDFIAELKKAKEANFVVPEKYQFGEATLTEAEFNKLLGAFIVAVPVVSEFNSDYNNVTNQWETQIKTNVTFIDIGAGGTVIGIAEVKSSGSDKANQNKSISSAISAIPMQLQFEVRKVPAFQINTRVLAVSGGQVKLQLGENMGIKKGDEYSVITSESVEGFKNEKEQGLIQIKDVGSEVSTGQVVYSSIKITKDIQLHEIPRLGVDIEGYFHYIQGEESAAVPGLRFVPSRGFYGFRPYIGLQVPLGQIWSFLGIETFIPVNAIIGGEYEMHLGRLSITPYGGAGISYLYFADGLNGDSTDTNVFTHAGAQAYVNASFLVTRDLKIYADAGFEYWIAINNFFNNYGGLSFGAGVSYKL